MKLLLQVVVKREGVSLTVKAGSGGFGEERRVVGARRS